MHDKFSKNILWLRIVGLCFTPFSTLFEPFCDVDVIVGESGENDQADVNPTTKLRWWREPHGYDIFTIWRVCVICRYEISDTRYQILFNTKIENYIKNINTSIASNSAILIIDNISISVIVCMLFIIDLCFPVWQCVYEVVKVVIQIPYTEEFRS